MRHRLSACVVIFTLAASTIAFAVDGDKAAYMGGTLSGIKDKSEGSFSTADTQHLTFTVKNAPPVLIPYATIDSLEYGQKAGRRVAVAVFISPLALFSKKRNHYLTITYTDANGADQAAVFELGKDIIRTSLTVLELRSKKQIEFQDEDARKAMGGGK